MFRSRYSIIQQSITLIKQSEYLKQQCSKLCSCKCDQISYIKPSFPAHTKSNWLTFLPEMDCWSNTLSYSTLYFLILYVLVTYKCIMETVLMNVKFAVRNLQDVMI